MPDKERGEEIRRVILISSVLVTGLMGQKNGHCVLCSHCVRVFLC